jgi:hypothetical protein
LFSQEEDPLSLLERGKATCQAEPPKYWEVHGASLWNDSSKNRADEMLRLQNLGVLLERLSKDRLGDVQTQGDMQGTRQWKCRFDHHLINGW